MLMKKKLSRAAVEVATAVLHTSGKAATGLFRWASTDHTGIARRLARMPETGFLDQLRFICRQLLWTILIAVIWGVWIFILIAFVIPHLLSL